MLKRRIFSLILILCFLTGCSNVKITTGLSRNEFAKIAGQKVPMAFANILLSESKNSYENMFNDQVWSKELNGTTVEKQAKDEVKDTIFGIVCARNMAVELGINITADDKKRIEDAAKEYMEFYDGQDCDFEVGDVKEFYEWLLMAERGFYAITDEVDTRVSTDEARLIQVQYIYFEKNKEAKEEAEYIKTLLDEGKEFVSMAMEYSDDENYTLELSRGEYIREFEDVAFNLESGEMSDIVETDFGYFIIKCTNYNMEADYDKQAEKVVFARRKQIFADSYLTYANEQDGEYNDRFWEKNPIKNICKGSGELYNIYKKNFISTHK